MLKDIIDIAKKASKAIMEVYASDDFCTKQKQDNSPVTKADLLANKIIIDGLKQISDLPIVTEESDVCYEIRKEFKKFWLVDPLDGTKDFIAKNGGFTINIALIDTHKPVLGVVYIPVSDDVYYAEISKGAYKNGIKIYNNSKRINLIASDSNFHSTKMVEEFFKRHNIKIVKKFGSSIKICKLAEGEIDIYPRLNGTKEWDTAASHIIANEAGCKLVDTVTKEELLYNKKTIKNNFFIASREDLSLE